MFRAARNALLSILRKPLFGTIVVPRNAAVDPALFPEEAYPIFCTKCGYLLRGLPDGKCPECGNAFERGRLLVRTYVTAWSGALWRDSVAKKWYLRFSVAGFILCYSPFLGLVFMKYFVVSKSPSPATIGFAFRLIKLALGATSVGFLFLVVSLVIAFMTYPRGSWKRRRAIIDAIKEANPRPK